MQAMLFQKRHCKNIANKLLHKITQTSVELNFDPPLILVSKLPGSIYATLTTKAGRVKLQLHDEKTTKIYFSSSPKLLTPNLLC